MCSTTRRPSPSGSRMSVRHRSNGSRVEQADRLGDRFGARRVEPHARQRELEQLEQIRLVVDDEHLGLATGFAGHETLCRSSVRRRRSASTAARFSVMRKCAPGRARQELERRAVRVGELARDVQPEPGAAGTRGEERLEDLRRAARPGCRARRRRARRSPRRPCSRRARRCGCCLPSSGNAARRCAPGSRRSGSGGRGRTMTTQVVGNLHDRRRPAACSRPARSRRSASA